VVQHHLELWNCDGTPECIRRTFCAAAREQAGRQASRTTVIIDTQCAKDLKSSAAVAIGPTCELDARGIGCLGGF